MKDDTLPVRDSAGAAPAPTARILVVEDDPITARYLDIGLRKMGYDQVVLANSSESALSMAQAMPCDLALMDIQIDGTLDGIEAARLLRDRYDVAAIFLTGLADEQTMRRVRDLQPLGYLVKPVKTEDLRTTLAAAMNKLRLERAAREREHWFDGVLELHRDALLACDNSGRVEFANSAARRLLADVDGAASVLGALAEGESTATLERAGSRFGVRVRTKRVVDARGRPLGSLVTIQDDSP